MNSKERRCEPNPKPRKEKNVPNRDQPETTNLEDTMLVAWLDLQGFQIKAWVSMDRPGEPRVSFDVLGNPEDIRTAMQAYYDNQQVGVQDYVRALKQTKSAMYNMRKIKPEMKGDRT